MNNSKDGIGVVIGRFQTYELHQGHLAVLDSANKHQALLIFIGICPSLGTKNDPLDFPTRKAMLQEQYPRALILPLPSQPTDEGWVGLIDSQISLCFPQSTATLYFGRQSAVDHYTAGKFPVSCDTKEIKGATGEEYRTAARKEIGHASEWRKGVIYSVHNQYPIVLPVVDICITREHLDNSMLEVLAGRRNNEGGAYRFPGGHVGLEDESYEAAARREVYEETSGCEVSNFRILGSLKVESKYNAADRGMMTTVFRADYLWGHVSGTDDLDHLQWINCQYLPNLKWADSHELIVEMLLKDIEESKK